MIEKKEKRLMKLKWPLHEIEIASEDYEFMEKIANNNLFKLVSNEMSYWRWNNLCRVADKVKVKCQQRGYDPKQVAPKFLSQFFEGASLEDSDNLQEIWAEIFLGESEKENSYSLRTLDVLKKMSHEEAQLFFNVSPLFLEIHNGLFLFESPKLFDTYKLSYEKRLKLQDVGLIGEQPMLPTAFPFNSNHQLPIILGNQVLILTDTTKTREILNLRVYNVSNAGRELFNIINSSTDNDYNKALGYELENTLGESISVSLSNIISISPNGGIEIEEENLLRKES